MRKGLTIRIDNTDKAHAQFIMAYQFTSILYSVSSRLFESRGLNINLYLYAFSSAILLWYAKSDIVNLFRKRIVNYLLIAIPHTLLFLVSFLRGTSLSRLTSYVILPLAIYLPLGISAYCVTDYQCFYDEIKKWSYAITGAGSLILLVRQSSGFYSMNFSYVLLFATLIHLNEAIKRKRFLFWLLSIYEVTLNLVFGSRGSILCLVAFVAIQFFLNRGLLAVKIPIVVMSVLAYMNLDWITERILLFMETHNIHSRTLTLLLTRIEYVSGRDVLATKAQEMIAQKPLLGWGVGAEVQVIGNYPHNIILELMIDYGIFIGLLIFIVLICLLIRAIVISKDKSKEILLLLIPNGFVMLFVSSSYLTLPAFYILMGFVLNLLISHRRNRKTEYDKI